MPRANRYLLEGHTYHVTHRCHDRKFLFQFALDRTAYQKMLRDRLAKLLRALGDGYAEESVGMNYQEGIEETLSLQNAAREPLWTESLAVGRRNFVEETGRNIRNRMRVTVETTGDRTSTWVAREDRTSYG